MLKQQMLEKIRLQGKSDSTFKTYWHWIEKFLRFSKARNQDQWIHPSCLASEDVELWLTYLANEDFVSQTTQGVALQALCYLYKHVLGKPLENINAMRAKRPNRIRHVLAEADVVRLFSELKGVPLLVAQLIYGCGLRIGDVVNLRIDNLSFDRNQIEVMHSKGNKRRYVGFPGILHDPVRRQVESMRTLWKDDINQGLNGVSLPYAFGRKSKNAGREFSWWYLFASDNYSRCPRSGQLFRHHRDSSHIGREIKQAAQRAGIDRRITSHCLRHSFATHSHENGVCLKVLQQLLGHNDLRTTETYLHADKSKVTSAKSPIELLGLRIVG